MTREEKIGYLANVALISAVDGVLHPSEATAIEAVRQEMGIGENEMQAALQAVSRGDHVLKPVGRYSDKVRNLEDMMRVSLVDGELAPSEKPEIVAFAKKINLTQDQLTEILSEARPRLKSPHIECRCPSCEKPIPPASKFCPLCGKPVPESR